MADDARLAEVPPATRRVRRRRKWAWCLAAAASLGLLAAVGLLPQALRWPPLRNALLDACTARAGVRLRVEAVRLHWLQPPVADRLRLETQRRDALLRVAGVRADLPLYRWVVGGRQPGTVTLRQPQVYWTLQGGQSNWSRAGSSRPAEPLTRDEALTILDAVGQRDLRLVIDAGQVVFEDADRGHPAWTAGDLSAAVEIKRLPHAGRQLVLHPGTMLTGVEVTPRMVDDLLKYVAPALADATEVSGRFSWENEACVLPVGDPAGGYLAGKLQIHSLRAGPGPLVSAWADAFGWPLALQIMEDCQIEFEMLDHRVFHRGFQLRMGRVQVETEGWVGLDEQLDLVAQLRWPTQGGTGQGQEQRVVRLPVGGTLRRPTIDWLALVEENAHWAGEAGQWLLKELPQIRTRWRQRQQRQQQPDGDAPAEVSPRRDAATPALPRRLPRLLPRWRLRPQSPPSKSPEGAAEGAAEGQPPGREV